MSGRVLSRGRLPVRCPSHIRHCSCQRSVGRLRFQYKTGGRNAELTVEVGPGTYGPTEPVGL
jgi:hypothetical protein